jgi:myo-inositol-1-phosphate synthase
MNAARDRQVGVWVVGGRGSVATTVVTGTAATVAGLAEPHGLVTVQPPFAEAAMPALADLVFGGHDVVETPLATRAARLVDAGVLPAGLPAAVGDALAAAEAEQRRGITAFEARTEPRAAIYRIASDLRAFRERHELERIVVVNLSSTEPPMEPHDALLVSDDADSLERALGILPPSSLYAVAAIECGCAFVDFTASTGPRLPAIESLAKAHEVPLAGSDGKTGETMVKSALAPAFVERRLKVRSWSATNLLGGGDGETLSDPDRARAKLRSKGRVLEQILGYAVEAPIRIETVRELGEWKTAWDHVVFEGFLGVRMRMQFTWEGCDSALAAPLVLDLVRLMTLALDRGESGFVRELAFFFKDPAGSSEHALHRQYAMLERWACQEVVV